MLPVGENVQFNVTSLDVIHSFWAYQLGVKADANPGVNNVAYTKPRAHRRRSRSAAPSCAALWHADMTTSARWSALSAFQAWAAASEEPAHRADQAPSALRADL